MAIERYRDFGALRHFNPDLEAEPPAVVREIAEVPGRSCRALPVTFSDGFEPRRDTQAGTALSRLFLATSIALGSSSSVRRSAMRRRNFVEGRGVVVWLAGSAAKW
jgi:hypothetical protein